ncbi:MAG: serine/threonine-protein kinase [Myxococcota bacterium]
MPSLAGSQIDKYDMIEEVGHGGMAVVYRGLDRVLKREVAVKVLHPHLADREESRLRLQREAIAVAKLRHENILEIFDYSGPEAAESYIVTEFIHGMTLKEWVDDKLDPRPAVAAMIVHRLCLALQHAHRGGIVHRDIKPENVMIRDDGVLKLMDFGIAQIIDNQKLTLTGQLIGSPAYMAPELISGRPLDQRTDLFSLGILLYQIATGRLPFTGRNPHEVLNRIADGDYPPAASICPLVDRELEDIIALALASDADERYQSVETFGQDLARYLEEVGVEPNNEELGLYFTKPARYVEQLDERVCETLTERAKQAAHDGETARAIRLLGRVLEIDASHAGAVALLQKLRLRERRNRRLVMIAAALITAGIILTIVRFLPSNSALDEGLAAAPHASSLDRVESEPSAVDGSTGPGPKPLPAVVPDDAGGSTSGGAPSEAESGPEPSTVTESDGSAEPTVAFRPGERLRRPKHGGPSTPRVPVTTPCKVSFSGIPLPTAKNLSFFLDDQVQPIKAMTMDVEFPDTASQLQIKDTRYVASRKLTRAQCEVGPVDVQIRARAARVKFPGLASDVVVICKTGCREKVLGVNQTAGNFRAVPIPKGAVEHTVSLLFKHEQYEQKSLDVDLRPGPNEVRVALVPRGR